MNRKLLSTAVIFLAAIMTAPLAQARDGRSDHRSGPAHRETHVERHYSHPGQYRGWHQPRHFRDHRGHAPHHYGPRHHRPSHYRGHHRSSSTPIILGSVIGGVVGHEIGHGDPAHTAAGAVIGTVIGYEITRHR